MRSEPFRVLSLDGGGMRGLYTATYLALLSEKFAQKRGAKALDLGTAFDLIVGTSTGAIIACALAAGVAPGNVALLYREHGQAIFGKPLPTRWSTLRLLPNLPFRAGALARGDAALRAALTATLGTITLGDVWSERGIALAVPAVEMSQHRPWVFKTPHLATTNNRDSATTLVDVCRASSAAPVYRSLAKLEHRDGIGGHSVFADGGLWANNPVLVALTEALEMTGGSDRGIEVFCLGTCPRPEGESIRGERVHRGIGEWKFGGRAAALAVDAQEFAFDAMAKKLVAHLKRRCEIIRFPRGKVPASMMEYLDLDETRTEAFDAIMRQARADHDMTWSHLNDASSREGAVIRSLFESAPVVTGTAENAVLDQKTG